MKFKLAFALHNHQPVGNFAAVFEEAHQKCYQPLLELISRFPALRFSLHQSGILWNWQKEHHPEYFELVGTMVDSGQVELLSGAFYEPILPAIPERDKLGQMRMLNDFLAHHFEVVPRGMWLAERVWEPHLPRSIVDAGLRYLPLDDTHFKYTGLRDDQLYGTFITEEEGKCLTLLPIHKPLRYLIPFGKPAEVIEFLRQAAHRHPGGLAVYADDGEKFGVWPKTYEHCYGDGWLEQFFTLLQENRDWLDVISLGEAVEQCDPLGRVYLPTASYSEMLHWALPAESFIAYEEFETKLIELDLYDTYGHFVRGGHWRGFLTKYPEANLMHKKMLAVSDLYDEVARLKDVDIAELERAKEFLYAGQCNCPYWHGVFGGLYLPHLRWAVYRKLIHAEKILRRLSKREISAGFEDRDRDGHDEIVLHGKHLSLVLCPARGGQMLELSGQDTHVNFTDCLTRRREGYHQKLLTAQLAGTEDTTKSIHDLVLTKEEGLERLLVEDWYLRRPLTDHFLADGTTLKNFLAGKYHELGDFVLEPYEPGFVENENDYQVTLSRRGHVWQGDYHCPVHLEKIITFPKQGHLVGIEYHIKQHDREIMPITFAVEFDFNLLAPDAEDRYALINGARPEKSHLAALDETAAASRVAYIDEYQNLGIHLEADCPGKIWRMPIYTVSLSEGGFEKVFQGNCTMFVFEKALPSGQEFAVKFKLMAGPLESLPAEAKSNRPFAARLTIK